MSELIKLTAADLAAAIAAGEVSRRRGRPGPPRPHRRRSTRRSTPSCTSTPRARWPPPAAVDAERAAGEPLGPLAGVPLAMKDVVVTKGLPTTAGSKILEGWRPPYDATITTRIKDAGIVMLGKTNMDEFAMGSSTENSAYRPTHNPWDLTGSRAARRAARPRRSRPSRRRSRSAPTPAARSASRPRSPASSGTSRPTARCRATA